MGMNRPDQRRGGYQGGPPPRDPAVVDALARVPELMDQARDPNGVALVAIAEKLGEHMARRKRMTTSQIRKIFSEFKKLEFKKNGPYQINILRAKLAYTAGRYREVVDLQEVLDKALIEVGTSEEKYRRFVDFFEAIVAFHKKYGGND